MAQDTSTTALLNIMRTHAGAFEAVEGIFQGVAVMEQREHEAEALRKKQIAGLLADEFLKELGGELVAKGVLMSRAMPGVREDGSVMTVNDHYVTGQGQWDDSGTNVSGAKTMKQSSRRSLASNVDDGHQDLQLAKAMGADMVFEHVAAPLAAAERADSEAFAPALPPHLQRRSYAQQPALLVPEQPQAFSGQPSQPYWRSAGNGQRVNATKAETHPHGTLVGMARPSDEISGQLLQSKQRKRAAGGDAVVDWKARPVLTLPSTAVLQPSSLNAPRHESLNRTISAGADTISTEGITIRPVTAPQELYNASTKGMHPCRKALTMDTAAGALHPPPAVSELPGVPQYAKYLNDFSDSVREPVPELSPPRLESEEKVQSRINHAAGQRGNGLGLQLTSNERPHSVQSVVACRSTNAQTPIDDRESAPANARANAFSRSEGLAAEDMSLAAGRPEYKQTLFEMLGDRIGTEEEVRSWARQHPGAVPMCGRKKSVDMTGWSPAQIQARLWMQQEVILMKVEHAQGSRKRKATAKGALVVDTDLSLATDPLSHHKRAKLEGVESQEHSIEAARVIDVLWPQSSDGAGSRKQSIWTHMRDAVSAGTMLKRWRCRRSYYVGARPACNASTSPAPHASDSTSIRAHLQKMLNDRPDDNHKPRKARLERPREAKLDSVVRMKCEELLRYVVWWNPMLFPKLASRSPLEHRTPLPYKSALEVLPEYDTFQLGKPAGRKIVNKIFKAVNQHVQTHAPESPLLALPKFLASMALATDSTGETPELNRLMRYSLDEQSVQGPIFSFRNVLQDHLKESLGTKVMSEEDVEIEVFRLATLDRTAWPELFGADSLPPILSNAPTLSPDHGASDSDKQFLGKLIGDDPTALLLKRWPPSEVELLPHSSAVRTWAMHNKQQQAKACETIERIWGGRLALKFDSNTNRLWINLPRQDQQRASETTPGGVQVTQDLMGDAA